MNPPARPYANRPAVDAALGAGGEMAAAAECARGRPRSRGGGGRRDVDSKALRAAVTRWTRGAETGEVAAGEVVLADGGTMDVGIETQSPPAATTVRLVGVRCTVAGAGAGAGIGGTGVPVFSAKSASLLQNPKKSWMVRILRSCFTGGDASGAKSAFTSVLYSVARCAVVAGDTRKSVPFLESLGRCACTSAYTGRLADLASFENSTARRS